MVGVNRETLWLWLGARRHRVKRKHNTAPRENTDLTTTAESLHRDPTSPHDLHEDDHIEVRAAQDGNVVVHEDTLRLNVHSLKEGEERKLNKKEEKNEEEEGKERERVLSRVTHLHLEKKGITHIEDVGLCPEARVLFLQHNHLTRLANLRPLTRLQELYLQDNHITRLERLEEVGSLRRLLVAGNRVGVVEGLPRCLTELHVQHQRLPPGDALVLDPHALAPLQDTLRVLDVSGNRMTEIGAVGLLTRLRVLRAAHNDLASLTHLCAVLGRLSHLREARLLANPVTAHRRYRPALIVACPPTLEVLDDKPVSPITRDFLQQARQYGERERRRQQGGGSDPNNKPPLRPLSRPEVGEKHLLFTPVCPPPPHSSSDPLLQTAQQESPATGPRYVLGALRRPEFDLILRRARRRKLHGETASKAGPEGESSGPPEGEWSSPAGAEDNVVFSGHQRPLSVEEEVNDEEAPPPSRHWPPDAATQAEKSVWFAEEEEEDDMASEEVPRLVPRPYWRNKPAAARARTFPTT